MKKNRRKRKKKISKLVKDLVIARLEVIPSNKKISIG